MMGGLQVIETHVLIPTLVHFIHLVLTHSAVGLLLLSTYRQAQQCS
jgi:hypothetical protein